MSGRRGPLGGMVASGQQQRPQRLPRAAPVSPQTHSELVCQPGARQDGAQWLQPVDVEQPAIEAEGAPGNGVEAAGDDGVQGHADRDAGRGVGAGPLDQDGPRVVDGGAADEEHPWEEARRGRKARDPGAPSVADWEAHQATHLPFRVWCQECVKGRRDNPPHRAAPPEVCEIPEVGMDYCFLRRAETHDKITVLLQKDRDSRAIRSQVVESKGVAHEEAVAAALRGIHEFGHGGKVILKADGENAVKALREQVLRRMAQGGFAIQPVAYEHESNGSVENGVRAFKGLFRVHLLALERKVVGHVPIEHSIASWLVEFIGDVLTKYLIGIDGKTAYERLFGKKKSREELLEFGEVVLWRKPRTPDNNVVADARAQMGRPQPPRLLRQPRRRAPRHPARPQGGPVEARDDRCGPGDEMGQPSSGHGGGSSSGPPWAG